MSHTDLYGRGYSDAPQTTYDATLYVTQLAFLMQHVKWDKAIVMGVSMVSPYAVIFRVHLHSLHLCLIQGGGIAASFTANFPELVDDAVVLIASAGLMEVIIGLLASLFWHLTHFHLF